MMITQTAQLIYLRICVKQLTCHLHSYMYSIGIKAYDTDYFLDYIVQCLRPSN